MEISSFIQGPLQRMKKNYKKYYNGEQNVSTSIFAWCISAHFHLYLPYVLGSSVRLLLFCPVYPVK